MQNQDANSDQRRGRDFRHQNTQRLEFSRHFRRAMLATKTKGTLLVRGAKGPGCCLQELAQSSIVSRVKGIVALLTIAGSLTIAASLDRARLSGTTSREERAIELRRKIQPMLRT